MVDKSADFADGETGATGDGSVGGFVGGRSAVVVAEEGVVGDGGSVRGVVAGVGGLVSGFVGGKVVGGLVGEDGSVVGAEVGS